MTDIRVPQKTEVVRWGDVPHVNVGNPTAYQNKYRPSVTGLTHRAAVAAFERDWQSMKESNPIKYERLLYAIRGRRISCPGNCSFNGHHCHAASLARMADELPERP